MTQEIQSMMKQKINKQRRESVISVSSIKSLALKAQMTSDKRNISYDSSKSRKNMKSNMQNEPMKKLTEILNVLGLNKLSD